MRAQSIPAPLPRPSAKGVFDCPKNCTGPPPDTAMPTLHKDRLLGHFSFLTLRVVAPVAPQRDDDSKQRNGEHVGGKLQRPALRDAVLRQGQGIDLPGDVDMKDAPDCEEERSQTCKERRRHSSYTPLVKRELKRRLHGTRSRFGA